MSKQVTFGNGTGTGYPDDGKEWNVLADGEPVGRIESHKKREYGCTGAWVVAGYTLSDDDKPGYIKTFAVRDYSNARQAFAAAKECARSYFSKGV